MRLTQFFAQLDTSSLPGGQLTHDRFQTGVNIFLVICGSVGLLVATIAGLRMTLSKGNPQAIAQARTMFIYAMVGIAVVIMAGTIVTFVLGGLK